MYVLNIIIDVPHFLYVLYIVSALIQLHDTVNTTGKNMQVCDWHETILVGEPYSEACTVVHAYAIMQFHLLAKLQSLVLHAQSQPSRL